MEIKKDIEELQVQREKLKDQRESLIKERDETVHEAEKLRKLKEEQKQGDISVEASPLTEVIVSTPKVKQLVSTSKQEVIIPQVISTPVAINNQSTPEKATPSRLLWLRKCVSGLFSSPEGKSEPFIFRASAKGKAREGKVTPDTPPAADAGNIQPHATHSGEQESSSMSKSSHGFMEHDDDGRRKVKAKGSKKTHSSHAAVEDAKAILESFSDERGISEGGGDELLKTIEDRDGELVGQAEEQEVYSRSNKKSRKRHHESEIEDIETESDTMVSGKRKRRQKISESIFDTDAGNGKSAAKRYNFRHSTM